MQVLGRPVQASAQQPSHAVVIARSAETIGSAEASCSFEVILTQPTFRLDTEALCQVSYLNIHWLPSSGTASDTALTPSRTRQGIARRSTDLLASPLPPVTASLDCVALDRRCSHSWAA